MAATWTTFQTELESIFNQKTVQNSSEFASKFASSFSNSTMGLASTTFGNTLTYGNYQLIEFGVKTFLDFNFNLELNLKNVEISLNQTISFLNNETETVELIKKTSTKEEKIVTVRIPTTKKQKQDGSINEEIDFPVPLHPLIKQIIKPYITELNKKIQEAKSQNQEKIKELQNSLGKLKSFISGLNLVEIPYIFLEAMFLAFWFSAQYTPLPPAPPNIAPFIGVTTLIPGIPGILSAALKTGFTSKDSKAAADFIVKGIQSHAKTITGTYSGLIVTPAATVPGPPLPWIGIL